MVGGRETLLALTEEPDEPDATPVFPDAESEAAYAAVHERLNRMAATFHDPEVHRVLGRSLDLLWRGAPHAVTGARSPSTVAGGLIWVVDDLVSEAMLEIVPFDGRQVREARIAHARFGKGTGHPAQLNFGDCMSYALAKVTGEPLLFKGDDFAHTDVEPAYRP